MSLGMRPRRWHVRGRGLVPHCAALPSVAALARGLMSSPFRALREDLAGASCAGTAFASRIVASDTSLGELRKEGEGCCDDFGR